MRRRWRGRGSGLCLSTLPMHGVCGAWTRVACAHRSGATCPHGSALGAPVVPDEKRMLVVASASQTTASNASALPPAAAAAASPACVVSRR